MDRIIFIPNSIDIDKSADGVRRSLEYRNILYVGRMIKGKGADILIRAFYKRSSGRRGSDEKDDVEFE